MAGAAAAECALEPAGAAGGFRLAGVLTVDTAARVLASGSRAFRGQASVTVDLTGVTQADSAGLSVLLTWVERARAAGQQLAFSGLPVPLQRIARLCAVESILAAAAG